ncbi:MAG: hypothetical protein NTX44_00375 [Ignavibacteriales bacterium]|nr:hypothetical protein [Ignavibacteriales bacterium]
MPEPLNKHEQIALQITTALISGWYPNGLTETDQGKQAGEINKIIELYSTVLKRIKDRKI